MWRQCVLVLLSVACKVTAGDTLTDEGRGEVGQPHQDVCQRVGNALCGSTACIPELEGQTFSCKCEDDQFYDLHEGECAHVHSCTTSLCRIGTCEDANRTSPGTCNCSHIKGLTPSCEVKEEMKEECALMGATPSVGQDVQCVCRPTEVLKNDRCLPTTCLNFTYTCEQLCRKDLLKEDHRCCQGWKPGSCLESEAEVGYCQPGYLGSAVHGGCLDACSADETNPVCSVDCTTNTTDGSPYNCVCKEDFELASDGLRCLPKTTCNAEELTMCREDQVCEWKEGEAVCKCASDQVERGGRCSDNCTLDCHHKFGTCRISNNTEFCHCASPLQEDTSRGGTEDGSCSLEKYSYVTSFKLNTSLSSWNLVRDCHHMQDSLTQAFSVLFGPDFHRLDVISCASTYNVRLLFNKKQDDAVLKRVRLCKHSLKPNSCYFWPDVHVISGSVGAIELENICETVLWEHLQKYEGAYVCKVEDQKVLFNCVNAAAVTGTETSGLIIKQHCSEANKPPSAASDMKKGKKNDSQIPPNHTAVIVGVVLAVLAALGIIAILVLSRKRKAAKEEQRRRQEKFEADLQQ